jgi:hypothetical protein
MNYYKIVVASAAHPGWQAALRWPAASCALAVEALIKEYRRHGMEIQIVSAEAA